MYFYSFLLYLFNHSKRACMDIKRDDNFPRMVLKKVNFNGEGLILAKQGCE